MSRIRDIKDKKCTYFQCPSNDEEGSRPCYGCSKRDKKHYLSEQCYISNHVCFACVEDFLALNRNEDSTLNQNTQKWIENSAETDLQSALVVVPVSKQGKNSKRQTIVVPDPSKLCKEKSCMYFNCLTNTGAGRRECSGCKKRGYIENTNYLSEQCYVGHHVCSDCVETFLSEPPDKSLLSERTQKWIKDSRALERENSSMNRLLLSPDKKKNPAKRPNAQVAVDATFDTPEKKKGNSKSRRLTTPGGKKKIYTPDRNDSLSLMEHEENNSIFVRNESSLIMEQASDNDRQHMTITEDEIQNFDKRGCECSDWQHCLQTMINKKAETMVNCKYYPKCSSKLRRSCHVRCSSCSTCVEIHDEDDNDLEADLEYAASLPNEEMHSSVALSEATFIELSAATNEVVSTVANSAVTLQRNQAKPKESPFTELSTTTNEAPTSPQLPKKSNSSVLDTWRHCFKDTYIPPVRSQKEFSQTITEKEKMMDVVSLDDSDSSSSDNGSSDNSTSTDESDLSDCADEEKMRNYENEAADYFKKFNNSALSKGLKGVESASKHDAKDEITGFHYTQFDFGADGELETRANTKSEDDGYKTKDDYYLSVSKNDKDRINAPAGEGESIPKTAEKPVKPSNPDTVVIAAFVPNSATPGATVDRVFMVREFPLSNNYVHGKKNIYTEQDHDGLPRTNTFLYSWYVADLIRIVKNSNRIDLLSRCLLRNTKVKDTATFLEMYPYVLVRPLLTMCTAPKVGIVIFEMRYLKNEETAPHGFQVLRLDQRSSEFIRNFDDYECAPLIPYDFETVERAYERFIVSNRMKYDESRGIPIEEKKFHFGADRDVPPGICKDPEELENVVDKWYGNREAVDVFGVRSSVRAIQMRAKRDAEKEILKKQRETEEKEKKLKQESDGKERKLKQESDEKERKLKQVMKEKEEQLKINAALQSEIKHLKDKATTPRKELTKPKLPRKRTQPTFFGVQSDSELASSEERIAHEYTSSDLESPLVDIRPQRQAKVKAVVAMTPNKQVNQGKLPVQIEEKDGKSAASSESVLNEIVSRLSRLEEKKVDGNNAVLAATIEATIEKRLSSVMKAILDEKEARSKQALGADEKAEGKHDSTAILPLHHKPVPSDSEVATIESAESAFRSSAGFNIDMLKQLLFPAETARAHSINVHSQQEILTAQNLYDAQQTGNLAHGNALERSGNLAFAPTAHNPGMKGKKGQKNKKNRQQGLQANGAGIIPRGGNQNSHGQLLTGLGIGLGKENVSALQSYLQAGVDLNQLFGNGSVAPIRGTGPIVAPPHYQPAVSFPNTSPQIYQQAGTHVNSVSQSDLMNALAALSQQQNIINPRRSFYW